MNKVKAVKSGQSTDDLFQPTWRYWKQVQFLLPCMNPRKSRDSLIMTSNESPASTSEITITTDNNQDIKLTSRSNARSKQTNVKEELMKQCLTALKGSDPQQTAEPKTAEDTFGTLLLQR